MLASQEKTIGHGQCIGLADATEHLRQAVRQLVALGHEDVPIGLVRAVLHDELQRGRHVKTRQVKLPHRAQTLGVKAAVNAAQHADSAGEVAVNLHEANGRKAVEPTVGLSLTESIVAHGLNAGVKGRPLHPLRLSEHGSINYVSIRPDLRT